MTDNFNEICEEERLTCCVCYRPYVNPYIINICLHAFCKECIELCEACPICRQQFKPENLLHDFDKANRVDDVQKKYTESLTNSGIFQDSFLKSTQSSDNSITPAPNTLSVTPQNILPESPRKTEPCEYGEFNWNYIFSLSKYIPALQLKIMSEAELGAHIEKPSDFLWNIVCNNVVINKDELKKLYERYGMCSCFYDGVSTNLDLIPPQTPQKLITLKSLIINKLQLPYTELCDIIMNISENTYVNISLIIFHEKISSIFLLLRKLIESTKVYNKTSLMVSLDGMNVDGILSKINTLTPINTVSVSNNTNILEINTVSNTVSNNITCDLHTLQGLFRYIPEWIIKAMAQDKNIECNDPLLFLNGLWNNKADEIKNEENLCMYFRKYNVGGLCSFIYNYEKYQEFSDNLAKELNLISEGLNFKLLSIINKEEVKSTGIPSAPIIIFHLILSGKVKSVDSFLGLVDYYSPK
jgi:hypothetical protein